MDRRIVEFIDFFGGKSGFCHNVTAVFGETVIKQIWLSDADHVSQLIPVKIGIKAIGRGGGLVIVQRSVTAGQMKAMPGVLLNEAFQLNISIRHGQENC